MTQQHNLECGLDIAQSRRNRVMCKEMSSQFCFFQDVDSPFFSLGLLSLEAQDMPSPAARAGKIFSPTRG